MSFRTQPPRPNQPAARVLVPRVIGGLEPTVVEPPAPQFIQRATVPNLRGNMDINMRGNFQ